MAGSDYIDRESAFYGRSWDYIHDGYFSSPEVARPMVAAVGEAVRLSRPTIVADIGGGTGFLLRQISAAFPGLNYVNVDPANKQLTECDSTLIRGLEKPAEELARADLAGPGDRLLLLARSLLHYFGKDGLGQALENMRRLALGGEYLVHQSACFDDACQADCLNLLFSRMNTDKWCTTPGVIRDALRKCGWSVEAVEPAPPLVVKSGELSARYRVGPEEMESVEEELRGEFGTMPGVFEPGRLRGFTAYLHYRIFTCRAV